MKAALTLLKARWIKRLLKVQISNFIYRVLCVMVMAELSDSAHILLIMIKTRTVMIEGRNSETIEHCRIL